MSASSGMSSFNFLPQGAIIQEFRVAGHNIVQSFPNAALYESISNCYFGETIGRTTNRIKDAVINNLNGRSYQLAKNNGPNSLHGGAQGWGRKTFKGPTSIQRGGKEGVMFSYVSPDGEEGYPGTVELRVYYTAWSEDEHDVSKCLLQVEFEVEFLGDECDETVVGVTNHSYFNLSGESTIKGTNAVLETDKYLPLDDTGIPLGNIENYPGIEARKEFTIGESEPDVDDCFIMEGDPQSIPIDTRPLPLRKLVALSHPVTNLHLEIYSTEPAFQFYTGKYIDIPAAENSPARPPRAGLCVEPSRYVNACNVPEWRKMVLLKRGEKWGGKSLYKAWKA